VVCFRFHAMFNALLMFIEGVMPGNAGSEFGLSEQASADTKLIEEANKNSGTHENLMPEW